MKTVSLPFPIGVRDQKTFAKDDPVTIWPEGMCNVRIHDMGGTRRVSPRNGLSKQFADALPGGVKLLRAVGRASSAVEAWGEPVFLAGDQSLDGDVGTPQTNETITGSVRLMDSFGNVYAGFADPITAGAPAQWVASDKSTLWTLQAGVRVRFAFSVNAQKDYGGSVGIKNISRVSYCQTQPVNAGGGGPTEQIWTAEVEDKEPGGAVQVGAAGVAADGGAVVGPWVFSVDGAYVYVHAADTSLGYSAGQYVQRFTLPFIRKVKRIIPFTYVPVDVSNANAPLFSQALAYLLILFEGTTAVSGAVTSGGSSEGIYARAGIYRAAINLTTQNAVALTAETSAPFANPATPNPDSHVSFRFREWIPSGRGRCPMDMAIFNTAGSDIDAVRGRLYNLGCVFAATTNDGFGLTNGAADKPTGDGGYSNLFCIDGGKSFNANTNSYSDPDPVRWQIDTESRKTNWETSGWYNDLHLTALGGLRAGSGGDDNPSLLAVTCNNATGRAYAAGNDSGGFNVFAVDYMTGAVLRKTTTGARAKRHCAAFYSPLIPGVSPASVVIGGVRNDDWPGSEAVNATLWFLDPETLAVQKAIDLGSGIAINMVDSAQNFVLVASDYY